MSNSMDLDYGALVGQRKAQLPQNGVSLFDRRMDHWAKMLHEQNEALRYEDAKLHGVQCSAKFNIDLAAIDRFRELSKNNCKLSYEVFDPSGNKRSVKVGELALNIPCAANKWSFYIGLRMSRNPERNPALMARLEPTDIDLGADARLPTIILLPDTINFTQNWYFLEGSMQDLSAAAILSEYDFSTRPSCKDVAQGLIAILLSSDRT